MHRLPSVMFSRNDDISFFHVAGNSHEMPNLTFYENKKKYLAWSAVVVIRALRDINTEN